MIGYLYLRIGGLNLRTGPSEFKSDPLNLRTLNSEVPSVLKEFWHHFLIKKQSKNQSFGEKCMPN